MSSTEDTKYKVVEDYEGGTFGMEQGAQTAEEWLDNVAEWLEADGYFGHDSNETMDEFKERWLEIIDEGREQELIGYIATNWDLDIVEVKC